jgi:hypothetical protein
MNTRSGLWLWAVMLVSLLSMGFIGLMGFYLVLEVGFPEVARRLGLPP